METKQANFLAALFCFEKKKKRRTNLIFCWLRYFRVPGAYGPLWLVYLGNKKNIVLKTLCKSVVQI